MPLPMPVPEPAARDCALYVRKVHEKAVIEKRLMAIERNAEAAAAATAAVAPAAPADLVHVITLENGEHNDSTLYRFEKGCYVEFSPGPSLLGRKVFLYTNYVIADDQDESPEFVRNQYYGLQWQRGREGDDEGEVEGEGEGDERGVLGAGVLLTDPDVYCRLRVARAGSFHYYFVYDSAESALGPAGSGWFGVAPTLPVPADAVACQTVLAKCLGPLDRWEATLRVAKESGYNAVHFSPVQELGASGSGYSVANQLRLNPAFGAGRTFADVEALLARLRADWGLLAVGDVVLNHTANETPWLAAHPEATYNCASCPHLRPAALLDALLARASAAVARGDLEPQVPRAITCEAHVAAVRDHLERRVLPGARLHELFACDAPALVRDFCRLARAKLPSPAPPAGAEAEAEAGERRLRLLPDPQCRRLRASVDMDLALQLYNVHRPDCADEEARLRRSCDELRRRLERLNEAAADELAGHLRAALDNVAAGIRYHRLEAEGRVAEVSAAHPLVPRYFTWACDVEGDVEAALYGDAGALCMAHNGWVMGADPLADFAARDQAGRVYLRRELIAWGDSVKLRYGARPEDSPFLWAHMREYVELTAEVFDGLRLDNCHSTPMHVAEYMLDCARNVKPDLYVVAELFTDSDQIDNIFVNRLGITVLIREALSAWDAREQGRLVHRFGGRPVGAFLRGARRAAQPRVAPALLMDATHDNPSPLRTRCPLDALPSAALVAMACCATGSTRGLDELVPHQVHVVDETRLYARWGAEGGEAEADEPVVGPATGMVAAKRALNELHAELAAQGYDEVFVDQVDADVVAVTRHDPRTRRSVILVAYTAFAEPEGGGERTPRPLRFEGELEEVALEATLRREAGPARPWEPHPRLVTGLRGLACDVRRGVPLARSEVFAGAADTGAHCELAFRPLRPGTVAAVRVRPRPAAAAALGRLGRALAAPDPLALAPALQGLDLVDLNALLYRCDAEERDCGGGGVYDVPGHGPLVYAGMQGVASLLAEVTPSDDLGHPLCDNLRAGDWLAEYCWRRLEREPRLAAAAERYRDAFQPLAALPRFLVPAYFAALAEAAHRRLLRAALAQLGAPGRADSFAQALALTSVQLLAAPPSARLPPPWPAGAPTLAAGLPHFAVGCMRCWGRDTFVALRGLLLLTGRHAEARAHILAFAACLRHGLVPNLLDGGRGARYNCRDAVWWWLQAVRHYCDEAPGGAALLAEPVARLFPRDDAAPQPLHDVMQEALDVHFQGLAFRERNAGRAIDAHMSDKGFDVQLGVDPDTGFPFGGNDHNCGTWMDKMGSSEAAGTRGRPATPRDGTAVELAGLAYSAVAWLAAQHRAGRYPYPGVVRRHRDGSLTSWSFAQWAERMRRSFERCFWVPAAPGAADARPDLVHRRAIYKDSHGASRPWADYQLRCNFPIAMAVAPELFDPAHAWAALDTAERLLLGPLGVRTLDPEDWAYRGDYDNADDGTDPATAHGFNYHQGPEWLWPLGFLVRARLNFAHECGRHARTVAAGYAALAPLVAEIRTSPWRGLPELTNANGAPCPGSCRTQAWSSALALEALHELRAARRARPLAPE